MSPGHACARHLQRAVRVRCMCGIVAQPVAGRCLLRACAVWCATLHAMRRAVRRRCVVVPLMAIEQPKDESASSVVIACGPCRAVRE